MKVYNIKKSIKYNEILKKWLPGGVNHNFNINSKDQSIHFKYGKNSRLFDIDGNEYLDLFGKYGSVILGHNNEQYNEAIVKCLNNVSAVSLNDSTIQVCKMISQIVPCAEMLRFCLSGSEAVYNSIRLARAYTGRNRILRFRGHFHGTFDSILGGDTKNEEEPIVYESEGVFKTNGRADKVLENEMYMIEWNNVNLLTNVISKFYHNIAAVILEVHMVNAGSFLPDYEFLIALRTLCTRYNIVLIFDEIITGFRVGLGGAQKMYNIIPDLTLLGKAISNGSVPVTVLAGKHKIMELYEKGTVVFGGTHNGYPLGLAAVLATLDLLQKNEDKFYGNMKEKMELIQKIFLEEASKIGLNLFFRGHYSCSSLIINENVNESSYSYARIQNDSIIRNCLQRYGLLIAPTSRFFPNVELDISDIYFIQQRVGDCLKEVATVLKRIGRSKNFE